MVCGTLWAFYVSTHSRAEAAARAFVDTANVDTKFQHTAARRRLQEAQKILDNWLPVSTHSRAEAAASARYY